MVCITHQTTILVCTGVLTTRCVSHTNTEYISLNTQITISYLASSTVITRMKNLFVNENLRLTRQSQHDLIKDTNNIINII